MQLYRLNAEEQRMADDYEWGRTAPEVQQYPGQLVLVYKKRIVGAGLDENRLLQEAAEKEQCHRLDIAVIVVPPDDLSEIPH